MKANMKNICPADMSGTVQKLNILPPFQYKINTFWLTFWLTSWLPNLHFLVDYF